MPSLNRTAPLVVGIGEVLWDLLPGGRRLGGAPANFAYHAMQQGARAFAVSAIGDDRNGLDLRAELESKGLSTAYLAATPDHPTGTVGVELRDGIPSYTIHAPVAWDFIPWDDRLAQLAGEADAVCFGTLAQRGAVSAATIQRFLGAVRPDCLRVFDVNLRQHFYSAERIEASLRHCDLLKISDEELPAVARLLELPPGEAATAELRRRYGLRAVVLTLGPAGCRYDDGRDVLTVPAFDYGPKVDTVGCGDSFTATLTAGLLFGLPPRAALEHASKVAGLVCARAGAMPEIPEELKINTGKGAHHDLK